MTEIRDDTPSNNLPDWKECSLRVGNSKYAEEERGGEFSDGAPYANELHRFIYEYDDSDPYRSAWFLHRLEKLIEFVKSDSDELVRCLTLEVSRLKAENERLKSKILAHNQSCHDSCEAACSFGCAGGGYDCLQQLMIRTE
jgi:hypothetical protein